LSIVEDLVKSEKCVPLANIVSMAQRSADEVRYKVERAGKRVGVKVKVIIENDTMNIDLEVNRFKRDSFQLHDSLCF
jgi:predicted amino acid-binding ACT domain protein